MNKQRIILDFEGEKAQVRVLTPLIFNVFWSKDGDRAASKAIEGEKELSTDVEVEKEGDFLWVRTKDITCKSSSKSFTRFTPDNSSLDIQCMAPSSEESENL